MLCRIVSSLPPLEVWKKGREMVFLLSVVLFVWSKSGYLRVPSRMTEVKYAGQTLSALSTLTLWLLPQEACIGSDVSHRGLGATTLVDLFDLQSGMRW